MFANSRWLPACVLILVWISATVVNAERDPSLFWDEVTANLECELPKADEMFLRGVVDRKIEYLIDKGILQFANGRDDIVGKQEAIDTLVETEPILEVSVEEIHPKERAAIRNQYNQQQMMIIKDFDFSSRDIPLEEDAKK